MRPLEHDLTIVPVINKIDLPSADIERVREQIDGDLGLDPDAAILCSAKEGTGIEDVLEAIVQRLSLRQRASKTEPLAALIFDAHYDPFRGSVIGCRLFSGRVRAGDTILLMSKGARYKVEEVGQFLLKRQPKDSLNCGEVGYIIAGIKRVSDTKIGDTITLDSNPASQPLPGFREAKPVVFSSIYPISSDDYPSLADALEKYVLNDAALTYQKDSSAALGIGFRCGFLGLLHLEIVQERLEREFDQSIIMTVPTVQYQFVLTNGETAYG